MRSLGRILRQMGKQGGRGAGPHGLLFSNMAARSPLIASLRRLARRASGWKMPRHAGRWASACFLSGWIAYGMLLGGHVSAAGDAAVSGAGKLAASLGLGIESVKISGHEEASEGDILAALDLDETSSLLTFDAFAARESLSALGWVESASVQKQFPDTLKVEITERDAFALWQIGGLVSIIDRNGRTIGRLEHRRHASLPMVVGYGANRAAAEIVDAIAEYPRISSRARAAVRVAERRWNLLLDNGIEVRLPEQGAAEALAELNRFDAERQLLARDILTVDMRLEDRVAVRLSETGVERLEAQASAGPGGLPGGDT